MVKRKIIVRSVMTRYGVRKFEETINEHMAKGWEPISIELDQKLFRVVCFALLTIPVRCVCQCGCCTGEAQHTEGCECACDCCMMHSHLAARDPDESEKEEDE